jgi:DNA-binding CsgD family transcriptional regulator
MSKIKPLPDAKQRATDRAAIEHLGQYGRLTRRERDIFRLWSEGKSQEEIAKNQKITQPAVAKALQRIKTKLKAIHEKFRHRKNEDWDRHAPQAHDQGATGDRRHNGKSMQWGIYEETESHVD